ncbi:hypothetical protein F2Q69_00009522 [Brassica cretica]|uniref:Phosphatidylinositol-specific phospholipase C X domain-containing protein n=1 Tax=Brassica cretica TaxID=69181 RepID=A0A8S9NQZ1_BRACR|nr:hypothetical protein F2Q69_00009522 [Brassica cretica]
MVLHTRYSQIGRNTSRDSIFNDALVNEVVDPTVSFAEDSARTVVRKVVDPAVTFVEDSARTVIQEVMNPTVTSVEDSARTDESDRRIVWPGTHHSATNGLLWPDLPLVECQRLSIYEQLVLGTRVFDIHVQNDRRVCHGDLPSYNVDVVLNDVIRFVSETQSEIIILEIRTEFGKNDPPEFDTYLVDKLGPWLIHQDDNLFNKQVSEILPKKVICIWKPRESPKPVRGGALWNSDYLKDNWTNTDLPWTKFQSNMNHLKEQPPISSRRFFYRVENTLTPQPDSPVLLIKPVNGRIRGYARLFISRCKAEGCIDKLQIFSMDFINEDFVDSCIGLTYARINGRV